MVADNNIKSQVSPHECGFLPVNKESININKVNDKCLIMINIGRFLMTYQSCTE